ncbi:MAG: hypothetical protein Kow00103_02310 [Candidatus Caldatribacteriota bacterium]
MFRKPMKMRDLEAWGVPSFMVDIWEKNYSPFLLPVQEEAVKEYGVLDYLENEKNRKEQRNQHLLVLAPTSSGKTFIGEMAAITQAIYHKKTLYLVPLRSLAEEKYEHFKLLYSGSDCKLKIRISSRDRREDDKKIIKGDYQLAILVYEKFNYFLLKYPLLLKGVSLIIIDEMQLINDPVRGPLLEEMIKYIRQGNPQIKLIGLSAYLENKAGFLNWFSASYLLSYQRPVELRKGILRGGIFRYITHNREEYGEEEFFKLNEDEDISYEDGLINTLSYFIRKDEPTLLFFPTRKETRRWAAWLAEKIDAPRAEGAISELSRMEETSSRDELLFLLEKGIAYHNADLSWEERKLIEDYLKAGEIKLICATTTLAMGVNLPFKNVILSVNKFSAEEGDYQNSCLVNLSSADVENMGGRAGRFNREKEEFGRVIFLADSPFSETVLQNLYFNFKSIKEDKKARREMVNEEGELYDSFLKSKSTQFVRPKKNEKDFITFVLKAIVAGNNSPEKLYKYIQEITITNSDTKNHNYWMFDFEKEDLEQETEEAIARLRQENLITKELSPTPEGVLICAKGISISTYLYFKKYLEEKMGRLSELEIITLLTLSEEGKRLFLPFFRFNYPLKGEGKNKGEYRYPENIPPPALFLYDWIGEKELKEIEKEYKIYSGMMQRLGESFSWLADALGGVAENLELKQENLERINLLADRLAWGVQEEGLKLARLHIPGLSRSYIRRLLKEGYEDSKCLSQLSEEELSRIVPKRLARRIKKRFSSVKSKIEDKSAVSFQLPGKNSTEIEILPNNNLHQSTTSLEVNRHRPDRIIFMGEKIETTATEFSLLYLLAQHPERVISYEEILNEIWQEEEDAIYNRVSFHLSKIRKNIFKVLGKTRRIDQKRLKHIFSVVPGRGIMLRLKAEEIKIT